MSLPILISILILFSLLLCFITIKAKQSIRVFHSDRKRVRDLTEKITLLGQKLPNDSTYFRFSILEEILREASDIKSQLQTINHAFLREKVKTAIATLAQIETILPCVSLPISSKNTALSWTLLGHRKTKCVVSSS